MRARWLSPRNVVLFALGAVLLYAVYLLRSTLMPVFVAFFFAYAMHPLIDRLLARPRWKLNRSATSLFVLGIILVAILLFLGYLIPALTTEINNLRLRLPIYFDTLRRFNAETLAPALNHYLEVSIPTTFMQLEEVLQQQLETSVAELASTFNSGIRSAFIGTVGVLKVIFNVLLVPFFFFFFLRDFPAIKHFIKELFPPRHREQVLAFVRTVDDTLAHFIRGQLTVALVLAALYSVGLTLIGLDLAIFLGVLSGLLFLVPYVGIAVAFSLSVLFSLLNFSGWLELVWIGMLYAVLPMVEMFFLTPRIVGVRLRLSPAVVIFALLAFGGLFGVLGVVIALPVTALIKVVGQQLIAWYKSSSFFVSDSPTSSMASTMQTKK